MRISPFLISLFCLLAAILTVCSSQRVWRPQGRFGKRLAEDARHFDFGISRLDNQAKRLVDQGPSRRMMMERERELRDLADLLYLR